MIFQLHTKRRNRLEQVRLNNLVYVKYNRALRRRYNIRDTIDPISLTNIDDSNEWLIGKPEEEEDDYVFEDDDLTWDVVARASGVEEPMHHTRQSTSRVIPTPTPTPTPRLTKRSIIASSSSPNMDEDIDVDYEEDARALSDEEEDYEGLEHNEAFDDDNINIEDDNEF